MSGELLVHLTVNGQPRTVAVRPNVTLLSVLRDHLELTGTKRGCATGDCGACTVQMDGEAAAACLTLAVEAEGSVVTTVEGLSRDGDLHPLQKAFVKHGALQCGYCTAGALMSAKALIDREPHPSRDEITDALSGNLCRCASYPRMISAVEHWTEFEHTPLDTAPHREDEGDQARDHAVVGHAVPRYDGPDKVSGRAKYTADIRLPDTLVGKILGSPVAHGILRRVDASHARALPGVLAVITGADVPDTWYGISPAREDEQILAKDRVRYVGDEIAAVAAVDEDIAEQALRLIEVEIDELPAVFDAESALAPGAPVIHPEHPRYAGNVNTDVDWNFGDVDAGFDTADVVREQRFVGNRTYQAPLEPHATLARWEPHADRLTLWTSTQTPHYVHRALSRTLGVPMGNIRVIRPAVGGGFGAKAEATPLEFCAAILARRSGRPVRMEYSREEMFRHFRGRHKQYIDLKIGVKRDGTITAVEQRVVLDGGAYTSFGVITAYYAGSMLPVLYKIPNYRYHGVRAYTNLPASGAFRGHGVPQPRFAFESLLDMIAEDLGLDPIEMRLRNAMEPNTRTCNALEISSCEMKQTLTRAREASGWAEKRSRLPRGKGIGVGCGGFVSGAGYPIYRSSFPHSNAMIRVHEDGTAVSLHIAAADIGQGSDTVLTQIAAEALGVPYRCVWLADCDTVVSPLDLGSYSSRVTLMGGHAVREAALRVKEQLLQVAADELGAAPAELIAHDGRVYSREQPGVAMDWAAAARLAFARGGPVVGTGSYSPPVGLGGDFKGGTVGTSPAYSFSTVIAEVSVDLETGFVTVDRVTDFSDAGTVINPLTFHGQVEGAIVMGLGETLIEDTVAGPTGKLLNPNLHDYLIPTIRDTPEIHSVAVESYEPNGPFGAKEIGEGSLVPVLGAIANAIYDACGVRVTELPITPEKILRGLASQRDRALISSSEVELESSALQHASTE
ncbi:MAG TPA: molybdopterin cofactor-binding domain-containing protein [Gemmatimonadaceae bacterium]|nr:molybdopterin cofactor-binding domain-containing protein [Gemmatimonadaceae bacterium]